MGVGSALTISETPIMKGIYNSVYYWIANSNPNMIEWKGSIMATVRIKFKMGQNFDQNSTQPAHEKRRKKLHRQFCDKFWQTVIQGQSRFKDCFRFPK
jgi:hypothetical protein